MVICIVDGFASVYTKKERAPTDGRSAFLSSSESLHRLRGLDTGKLHLLGLDEVGGAALADGHAGGDNHGVALVDMAFL